MTARPSLQPSHFQALYQTDPDPWKFATSDYERDKYAATIAALPRSDYRSGFEIGGSIGVLTEKLAEHCQSLLSIDVSPIAQEQAIQRCRHLPQVHFQLMCLPDEYPPMKFDLIVLSEVGYYWCWDDLHRAQQQMLDSLEPAGHLLLVHWTEKTVDCPLTGDEVHDAFLRLTSLRTVKSQRQQHYRLDLLERL